MGTPVNLCPQPRPEWPKPRVRHALLRRVGAARGGRERAFRERLPTGSPVGSRQLGVRRPDLCFLFEDRGRLTPRRRRARASSAGGKSWEVFCRRREPPRLPRPPSWGQLSLRGGVGAGPQFCGRRARPQIDMRVCRGASFSSFCGPIGSKSRPRGWAFRPEGSPTRCAATDPNLSK